MESSPHAAARARFRWRALLAGPLVLATSIAVVCGGALWLPAGSGGVDHLVLPLIVFPVVWTGLFFHACLDRRLLRAYAIQGALLLANAALILPRVA